jgi:F-type H+-transporting ATPase subunit epsilon
MMDEGPMRLHVVTPASVVIDASADKVSTEAVDGAFTLLPRHVDFVAALVQGLLTYVLDDVERLVAIDGGILVKHDRTVHVATGEAIRGDDAADLQRSLSTSLDASSEAERRTRSAIAHLETDAIRRLMELEDHD